MTDISVLDKAVLIAQAHAILDSIEYDLRFIIESIKERQKKQLDY